MHHFCTHSVGQNEAHGPHVTAKEAGKCSFPVCPGKETGSVSMEPASTLYYNRGLQLVTMRITELMYAKYSE